jgi:hypothetical protein
VASSRAKSPECADAQHGENDAKSWNDILSEDIIESTNYHCGRDRFHLGYVGQTFGWDRHVRLYGTNSS